MTTTILYDSDEIEPDLNLGSIKSLYHLATLDQHRQSKWRVISLLEKDQFVHHTMPSHVDQHLMIEIRDESDAPISRHFDACHDFINHALADGKRVLVHCMAGISRSSSIIIAHLILKHRIDFEHAFMKVRNERRIVRPNSGFRKSLRHLASCHMSS